MEQNNSAVGKAYLKHLLFGVAAGLVTTFIFLLLFAFVLTLRDFGGASASPFSTVAFGAGAFFAGYTSARLHKMKGLVIGISSGAVLFLILAVVGFAVGNHITSLFIIKLLVCLAASALGGVIGVNKKEKRKYN